MSEYELIRRYREMALHPECDQAIENVINEAIVSDLDDSPVEIDLSNLNASDGIKKKIREEFKHIKDLLDFDKKSHEIFRNWYIDGRIYYNKVIDIKSSGWYSRVEIYRCSEDEVCKKREEQE